MGRWARVLQGRAHFELVRDDAAGVRALGLGRGGGGGATEHVLQGDALLRELREQAGIGAEEDEDLLEQRRALLAARGEEEEEERLEERHRVAAHHEPAHLPRDTALTHRPCTRTGHAHAHAMHTRMRWARM